MAAVRRPGCILPMRGTFTGAATPQMTVKPEPRPRSRSDGTDSPQRPLRHCSSVGGPDVAIRIAGHVGEIIWMLPAWKTWMTSPVLVPAERPLGSAPRQERDGWSPHVANPDVVVAVDVQAPGMLNASPVNLTACRELSPPPRQGPGRWRECPRRHPLARRPWRSPATRRAWRAGHRRRWWRRAVEAVAVEWLCAHEVAA